MAEIFLELQAQGAHNINLVTPGQWQPWIIAALDIARARGLHLPIVCNTGGYETVESVEPGAGISTSGWPMKYVSSALSAELSAAPDYFAVAARHRAMMAQAGHPVFDADGILQKGVILRHLALPGHGGQLCRSGPDGRLERADPGCFHAQRHEPVHPFYKAADHGIGRRITTYEYRRVVNYAMDNGPDRRLYAAEEQRQGRVHPHFDLTGCVILRQSSLFSNFTKFSVLFFLAFPWKRLQSLLCRIIMDTTMC